MKSNKTSAPQFKSCDPSKAPRDLKDRPFYKLELDEEQKVFRDAIYNPKNVVVLCNSKAGTGKTTVALGTANLLCQYGLYAGIIYVIAPTQEEKQGFLPGDIEDKTAPYMGPLRDACLELDINPFTTIESDSNPEAMKEGTAYIKFESDTYLRGCNLQHKVIIIDEAQNYYFDELKKTLTRIHDNCKCIVIGHDKQCDLYKHPEKSGFGPYLKAFAKANNDWAEICTLKTNHRGRLSNFCDNVTIDGEYIDD